MGDDEESGDWVNALVAPVVAMFIKHSALLNTMPSSFCMASWNGTEIAKSLNGAPAACSAMPLNPNSSYLILSLSMHASWLPPTCPATISTATSSASMCLAMSTCGGSPTRFLGISGSALGCMVESVSAFATSGIGSAASAALAGSVPFVGAGFSAGADLYAEVPLWHFGKRAIVKVYGHYASVMAIDLGAQFARVLGLADGANKFISFRGSATFIVRFPSLCGQHLIDAAQVVKSDPSGWMTKIADFQMALTATVSMSVSFSKSSNPLVAMLPDFPSIRVALLSGIISTATRSGVEQGAYFLATTGNSLGSILANLASWVKLFVGDALDAVLPDAWKMDTIVGKMQSSIKVESMFSLAFSSKRIGFFLQPILGLSLSCQVQFLPFGFGCAVNLETASILFNMFKQGAEWVVARAKDWFEQSGRVISRMTEGAFSAAKRWAKSLFVRAATLVSDPDLVT